MISCIYTFFQEFDSFTTRSKNDKATSIDPDLICKKGSKGNSKKLPISDFEDSGIGSPMCDEFTKRGDMKDINSKTHPEPSSSNGKRETMIRELKTKLDEKFQATLSSSTSSGSETQQAEQLQMANQLQFMKLGKVFESKFMQLDEDETYKKVSEQPSKLNNYNEYHYETGSLFNGNTSLRLMYRFV